MPQSVVLENGLTVVMDADSRFASAAFSVCLSGGIRDEEPAEIGITHALEHLLFKRTRKRTTREIAEQIDDLGCNVNAFTDADSLCIFGVVPAERLLELMEFIAELILEPNFTEQDVELEKEIIRQEILEAWDSPIQAVHQRFCEILWPQNSLRFPVFGTLESMAALSREMLLCRLSELRVGRRMAVCAAGNVDPEQILAHARGCYVPLDAGSELLVETPEVGSGFSRVLRPVNQAYISLGQQWPGVKDKASIPGMMVPAILGEGMSSRLFQVLREELALAYDVGCDLAGFGDAGLIELSAAVERRNLDDCLRIIANEWIGLGKNPPSREELARAKRLALAQLAMEQDSITGRMWRAYEGQVNFNRPIPVEELRAEILSLSIEDMEKMLEEWVCRGGMVLVLGGDVDGYEVPQELLSRCGGTEFVMGANGLL